MASAPDHLDPDTRRCQYAIAAALAPRLQRDSFLRSTQPFRGVWSVAVAVRVVPGPGVNKEAGLVAVGPAPTATHDDAATLLPGIGLRFHSGTHGHLLWPPESSVLEVGSGPLAGSLLEFILDPDPRPAGRAAACCAALLVDADEPLLADADERRRLSGVVASLLQQHGLAPIAG